MLNILDNLVKCPYVRLNNIMFDIYWMYIDKLVKSMEFGKKNLDNVLILNLIL
jgi:hypothetical protein